MYALYFLVILIYMNLAKSISIPVLYTVLAIDGLFFGVIMSSTNGFCGLLSNTGAPYAIIGNALAGVFSTILRIISKPIGKKGEVWFYFGVCLAIIILGELFLFIFQFTDYFKYRMTFTKKGVLLCDRLRNICYTAKKIWLECLQVILINAFAYVVYPGYATSCQLKHERGVFDRSWTTTIIISCYVLLC